MLSPEIRFHFPYTPTDDQARLIAAISDFLQIPDAHAAFMLKGYAGTGKTSIVAALVKALPSIGIKTVLLAPTGRAAKVIAGYAGKPAYTIHKKIYHSQRKSDGTMVFALAKNIHANTLFIIDEASMIGQGVIDGGVFQNRVLLDDLISYVQAGTHCKLFLVGDTAQLPPIGCEESPALDLNYMKAAYNLTFYHQELSEVVRQALHSNILKNASNLRWRIARETYQLPLFRLPNGADDFVVLSNEDLANTLQEAYRQHDMSEVVVLCRSNKRANNYNQQIRYQSLFRESEIEAGDLIMAVKNNYFWLGDDADAGFIANGDMMKIRSIRHVHEQYGYRFAELTVEMIDYPKQPPIEIIVLLDTLYADTPSLSQNDQAELFHRIMADYAHLPTQKQRMEAVKKDVHFQAVQIKFAYALTCHKAQGGQWKVVFVDQGFFQNDMLHKEYLRWLYTAVTRAREKLYLMGFPPDFFREG